MLLSQVIWQDGSTGAPTLLFRVHVDRGISWELAQSLLRDALTPAPPPSVPAVAAATAAVTKPRQKLKIRIGGQLVNPDAAEPGRSLNTLTADGTDPGRTADNAGTNSSGIDPGRSHRTHTAEGRIPGRTPDNPGTTSDVGTNAASMPAAVSPASDAPAGSAALETQLSSVDDLLQLQSMEQQTRLQSLAAADAAQSPGTSNIHNSMQPASPEPSHLPHTHFHNHLRPSQQHPTENGGAAAQQSPLDGSLPYSPNPSAIAGMDQQPPSQQTAFPPSGSKSHSQASFASDHLAAMGSGRALEAALNGPTQAEPLPPDPYRQIPLASVQPMQVNTLGRIRTVNFPCSDCFVKQNICCYIELSLLRGTTAVRMQWLGTKGVVLTSRLSLQGVSSKSKLYSNLQPIKTCGTEQVKP